MDKNATRIIRFLEEIGLPVKARVLGEHSFLPGISVDEGTLYYDPGKLEYPGDLLHEAGHLAILPSRERQAAGADFSGDGGNEMAAIAWSYAACMHLDVPLDVLFHENGYKGDAAWLAEMFSSGCYIGLPILVWKGMACDSGETKYPKLGNWLCP